MIVIRHAVFPADLAAVRRLFFDYAAGVDVDLAFQGFDQEVATLPGRYAPPQGRLLLATIDAVAVGCVALRAIDDHDGEMKRLYVDPSMRGTRLGLRLVEAVCHEARVAGYARLCLDTLPTMRPAQALYAALGFVTIEPYAFNPVAGARFLALDLQAA